MSTISMSVINQFNQMKKDGTLGELDRLKHDNKALLRLIDDISCLVSYTTINAMLDFVIAKFLDYFIPQFLAFVFQPPRKTFIRQYCYESLKPSNVSISIQTYSLLISYFKESDFPSYNWKSIENDLNKQESEIPDDIQKISPSIIIPLRGIGGTFGIVILSEKVIGNDYTSIEREYIQRMFSVLALTIQNGLHYETSITEPKTNLYTLDYYYHRLNETIALSRRQKMECGVIMIDIDHFKNFNDRWGHLAGDNILISIAESLKKQTRTEDCVARFGGEEFCILLINCNKNHLFAVCERIRSLISSLQMEFGNDILSVTISLGAYAFNELNTLSGEELIEKADKALYHSKKTGRNKTTVYSMGLFKKAQKIKGLH